MRTTRNLSPIPSPTPATGFFFSPDSRIRPHIVAPGLVDLVRGYILENYKVSPIRIQEWERVVIDPGGGCSAISDIILADAGGFYISCLLDLLSGAAEMLKKATPKVYGGIECIRVHSFPDFIIVLLPEHRDAILKQWAPLVGESVGERMSMLQEISKLPNVRVPGFPLPEGEA